MLFQRKNKGVMPDKFNRLADYNSEVSRGIQHTETYGIAMKKLQKEFDMWIWDTHKND